MGSDHLATGKYGEDAACAYLKERYIQVVCRNYRTPLCEVDIIARDDDTLCFIEVKTRKTVTKALPRQSVNAKKQNKLIIGAQSYLKENKLSNIRIRFDVMEVILQDPPVITHLKHAFQGH